MLAWKSGTGVSGLKGVLYGVVCGMGVLVPR